MISVEQNYINNMNLESYSSGIHTYWAVVACKSLYLHKYTHIPVSKSPILHTRTEGTECVILLK